ncbi:SRPBCC family protein [Mucilaginibacter aquaedulcis]|uniref:SRPBCC family protein n=1 Tax=Mucilaginibacter aquaedulcis TaxID=1187081 RepID=UPI0025B46C26|nr:SRPBCC domain-containing protein [Mucilaginibacter aquaedulcis]MDN3546850.1 SRPBCC domain-containing protein [Mucilaginibacter aquaedulcis]
METKPLVTERIYDAPANRIWKAITDNNDMKHWYFDIEGFMPVVGFEFQFWGKVDDREFLHICQVTEVVNGQKLSYTMTFNNFSDADYAPVKTEVCFELNPMGENQTRLKVTHTGLENFPENLKHFTGNDFIKGWGTLLDNSLKQYLKKALV